MEHIILKSILHFRWEWIAFHTGQICDPLVSELFTEGIIVVASYVYFSKHHLS